MKSLKNNRTWNAPSTQEGKGDYVGPGIKNPVGKLNRSYMSISDKKSSSQGKAPKKLA
jgi:hypothetical protein